MNLEALGCRGIMALNSTPFVNGSTMFEGSENVQFVFIAHKGVIER